MRCVPTAKKVSQYGRKSSTRVLANPMAYRRDRRKDQLLQEHGYFVLRFLADDVGRELDSVLDAIVRAVGVRGTLTETAAPLRFIPRGPMGSRERNQ